MTRREDIIVELGGDSRKLMKELHQAKQAGAAWAHGMKRDVTLAAEAGQRSWKKFGDEIGTEFVGKIKRMVDAFTLVGMINKVRNLAKSFDELKEKPDELEAAFGKLSGTQQEALENLSVGLQDYGKSVAVFLLGGLQGTMNILAEMLYTRKGFSDALSAVVDQDLAKLKEMEKAAADMRAAKIWEKEKNAMLAFKDLQEKLEFKRMTPANQIGFLQAKNQELGSLAEHAAATGDEVGKYKYASQILQNTDQIQTLQELTSPAESAPSQPARAAGGDGNSKPSVYDGVNAYNKKTSAAMARWNEHVRDIRGIRNPPEPNRGSNKDPVVAELQKITSQPLPVKVQLDE